MKVTGQLLSASPLLPQPMVPARYRDDSVSHAHNAKVAIPAAEVAQLFLGEKQSISIPPDPRSLADWS